MALRKNQSTLSATEKTAFVEAVLAQKQRPSLLGISYDTDPVAAPPVMAPSALPVSAPEERVPVRRRTMLPMFVLPHEIAALERSWP